MIFAKNTSALSLLILALAANHARASSAPKKEEKTGKGEQKADTGESAAAGEGEKKTVHFDAKKAYTATNNYVHNWTKFPVVSGKIFLPNAPKKIETNPDQISIVFFVSSWCLPCQKIFPRILELEKRYSKFNTAFVYIFANDTEADARDFAKEYELTANALLADHAIKKSFHNPPLPSVYISDRRGWLNHRILRMDDVGVDQVDKYLKVATAY